MTPFSKRVYLDIALRIFWGFLDSLAPPGYERKLKSVRLKKPLVCVTTDFDFTM